MTDIFTTYPYQVRLGIIALMFISLFVYLALWLYKNNTRDSFFAGLPDFIVFMILFIGYTYIFGASDKKNVYYSINISPFILAIMSIVVMIITLIRILILISEAKHNLTANSVQYALNNLKSGICFANSEGKFIIVNYAMNSIFNKMFGTIPNNLNDFEEMLVKQYPKETVELITVGDNYFVIKLSDTEVWKVEKINLHNTKASDRLEGYKQLVANDVTEIYLANTALHDNNKKLRETNEKMSELYERLSDRIREQETLNLKIRIHDDIGTSLLSLHKIMEESDNDHVDADDNIDRLEHAVSFFSAYRNHVTLSFQELKNKMQAINVDILLNGDFPEEKYISDLIVAAALECATNCKRHAKGDRVYVNIREDEKNEMYMVSITNNGRAPKGKIVEGVGLSSLRKNIENEGGSMSIYNYPKFCMKLKFFKES